MLKLEATQYAVALGISVNALVAVALREYLDRRPARAPGVESAKRVTPPRPVPRVTPGEAANRAQRRASKRKR